VLLLGLFLFFNNSYKKTSYYYITKNRYVSVLLDKGRYGEYLTYKRLRNLESSGGKFLFNVYIPKSNGETTEIDVLLICSKGVFVFESKNYSGWIFGTDTQKNWYQTLSNGKGKIRKELFYNPIMQNQSHIKHLKNYIGQQIPMHSIIVFSDRCKLKNIQIKSNDVVVINRYNIARTVGAILKEIESDLLSESEISEIYSKLFSLSQVDENTKAKHIADIKDNLEGNTDKTHESFQSDNINEKSEAVVEPEEAQEPVPEQSGSQRLKCPKCNGDLVLRVATKGANSGNQFYGCSNYPKCKYIQSITQKAID